MSALVYLLDIFFGLRWILILWAVKQVCFGGYGLGIRDLGWNDLRFRDRGGFLLLCFAVFPLVFYDALLSLLSLLHSSRQDHVLFVSSPITTHISIDRCLRRG